jgi:ribulose-5-phosphate 4-epimerase/fuculose-1-phosphate aldolase
MILRNHGLLACGRSIAEAYLNLYNLEKAFRIQVQALACGDDLIEIDPRAIQRNRDIYSNGRVEKPTKGYTSDMEWAAMRRKVDRLDDSYAL